MPSPSRELLSPLPTGSCAPHFALHDTPYSRVSLTDFRDRVLVLVFYVADWQPVASAQLRLYQDVLPHLQHLGAAMLGISVDGYWSHAAFARMLGLSFALLADDAPPGALARAYGVHAPETGRSRRAVFVIDGQAIVRWSAVFPDSVNPGADGLLTAIETVVERPACECGVANGLIGSA